MSETVQLSTAFTWRCVCGKRNFVLPERADLTPDEREDAYRELNDLEAWQELPDDWRNFEMVSMPEEVTCKKCGKRFETEDEA